MSRFSPQIVATLFAALIASVAPAQTTAIQDIKDMPTQPPPVRPIEDRRLPGTRQTNGDARWNTELARQVYSLCPGEAIIDATESGLGLNEAGARQTGDCARNMLMVRNDSKLAIQCKALLVYAKPDHSGNTRLEADRVIFPMTEDTVFRSYANASNMPETYSASCVAIPPALAPLGTPAECRQSYEGPSPDDFYPPGSKRREEQGAVVLEYTVTADTVPADVRVAASSGFADLDNAALKYSKHVRARGSCVGARARVKVRFTIKE